MQSSIHARFIMIVAASFSVSGCATRWHALNEDPAAIEDLPFLIRVTTTSGKHVVMYEAAISDGKIVGLSQRPYDSVAPRRLSIPLGKVSHLEYGEPSPAERAGVISSQIVGYTIVGIFVLAIIAALTWD